ncbi:hypothetical protein RhiirA1_469867 [Rhizophagus irregularis]|uniref:Uncharacterized protein n=1 Tax=Rhizophagus irregularis TaxID=588596 RepID=A0A2I1EX87_9GLOM|nr:hypothetical protein RhiirA1_469867 [Rhizophagus irregularis]PKY26741.1 hypothetical protein RhiirB3_442163 [Rhizophagus irregularis]CAB5193000.1 unnamed protein product [Rhizophagus irregularis]
MPDNIYIYSLIKSNEQNINYLNIELDFYDYHTTNYDEYSSTVLQNLGRVLPFKLEYLCLTLLFNINDFIEKLLIKNIIQNVKSENILYYIKEHIMKKERVKYLAFLETNCKNEEEDDDD